MNRLGQIFGRFCRWLWQRFWRANWKTKALIVTLVFFVVSPASGLQLAMIFIAFGAILSMLRALTHNLLPKKGK